MLITALRGFRVRLNVLHKFFLAHGLDESEDLCAPCPPFIDRETGEPEDDAAHRLLRSKVGSDTKHIAVFIANLRSHGDARHAYIAYDWIFVYAQRQVKPEELSPTPPLSFARLREEMLEFGEQEEAEDAKYQTGLYIVVTERRSGQAIPEIQERMVGCVGYRHSPSTRQAAVVDDKL